MDILTPPAQESHKQKPQEPKKRQKEVLCACVKFTYIGEKTYKFKDPFGYTYIVEKGNIVVVPKGSLERHLKARKGLFSLVT